MASMIGIGVAVDYSLFVLARYREEIAAGRDARRGARASRMRPPASPSPSPALTVIVVARRPAGSIDTTAMRSMALGAILVVAVSVLAAATLLPALISLLGRRAYARGRVVAPARRRRPAPAGARRARRADARSASGSAGPARSCAARSSSVVGAPRRPAGARASPRCSLHTGNGALRQFPPGNETRVGFEAAARVGRRRARRRRSQVVAPARRTAARRACRVAARAIREIARVASRAAVSRDGRARARHRDPAPRRRVGAGARRSSRGCATALPAGGARARSAARPRAQSTSRDLISGSMWKIVLFVLGAVATSCCSCCCARSCCR